jgi:hypothetical protein
MQPESNEIHYGIIFLKEINFICKILRVVICKIMKMIIRFEVFTVATMKNAASWDVTPCGYVKTDVS